MLHESVSIFAHLEEVSLLSCLCNLTATVRALAIYKLSFSKEGLTRSAVKTLIMSLVNITLVVKLFKDMLNGSFVIRVSCSNKVVL